MSTSYHNHDYDCDLHVPQNSQLPIVDIANLYDTEYIDNIDSQFQNLPKETTWTFFLKTRAKFCGIEVFYTHKKKLFQTAHKVGL